MPSGSMNPTIIEGDWLYVNKLAYDLKVPFTTWHIAQWSNPHRGDIVVFFSPYDGKRLVKRVIGLPGDTIELRNKQLIVNGKPVDYSSLSTTISGQLPTSEQEQSRFATEQLPSHSHAVMAIPAIPTDTDTGTDATPHGAKRNFGPVTVSPNHYFMMGDNRDNSFDSRYYGMVERNRIVGKATDVVFSLNKGNYWLPRSQRFLKALDSTASK